jgi:hypothetical protein
MTGRIRTTGRSPLLAAILTMLAMTPVCAHHQPQNDGLIRGVAITAISHGEMPVIARYRSWILDLAARQPVTDPTLRRLAGFVGLQRFACVWGLVPGSISDEQSPFNECSHAYLAGTRALLAHMIEMPGDQSAAREVAARIAAEIASDPTAQAVCSNSSQTFDSADVIGPDWQLAPLHAPTVLTFAALALLIVISVAAMFRRLHPRAATVAS